MVDETSKQVIYIAADTALAKVVAGWSSGLAIALDTEFVRTNTFYPKAGLFQLADRERIYLIDPLAVSDWRGFCALLAKPENPVIMHSCSEDLNLLRYFPGCLPEVLFDTQRAAAFLGYGLSVSYQALLAAEFAIQIGKGETRSDWLARPLSEAQLKYAALDVAYLHLLAERLQDRLESRNRLYWFKEDCAGILDAAREPDHSRNWERAYLNVGGAWRLDLQGILMLQRLCYWRESVARERDRPRSWILKDTELLSLAEIAAARPLTLADFSHFTALKPPYLDREFRSLTAFLASEFQPQAPACADDFSGPLDGLQRRRLKQAQAIVSELAARLELAPELLASKRVLLELADRFNRGDGDPWPIPPGSWRRELLEPALGHLFND